MTGAVAEIDPVQAAKWRVEAGQEMNLATLAEIQAGGVLSQAAMQDRWNHDPDFVAANLNSREQAEQDLLAKLDSEVDRMRRARDGDAAVDFQNAKTAAQQEAKAESLRRHQELQKRIEAQQAHRDQTSGRFVR